MTIVWVAEKGCYEDRFLQGLYESAAAAMAANPIPVDPDPRDVHRPGGWQEADDGTWSNGLDWDEAVWIYPETVRS